MGGSTAGLLMIFLITLERTVIEKGMAYSMKKIIVIALATLSALPVRAATPLNALSLTQLQQRLAEIDAELDQLARYSLRSGIGSIGYHSAPRDTLEMTEWVEIELGREIPLDEIVLIPVIRRDSREQFQADGFPEAFRVISGTEKDQKGVVVAEYDADSPLLPRIAPVVITARGITASWVRIEATRLSKQSRSGKYMFQLAEIMIFSHEENVALRRPVKSSSINPSRVAAWDKDFLVDGHTPYLMNAATGIENDGYISPRVSRPSLTVDLGEVLPISRIQLHALNVVNTVPQANSGDLGIPSRLRVDGATRSDFSDAKPLRSLWEKTAYTVGPIMMWNVSETACRYVRVTSLDKRLGLLGFAEIELFSNGVNVARGKPVSSYPALAEEGGAQALSTLTDGRNLYGDIIPIRRWLNELALRHDLEVERPLVSAELNHRYALQKTYLNRMIWLAGWLAAGTIIIILIEQIIRQRAVFRTRERIAANLHDELGANLHAIGLFGDLAKKEANKSEEPEKWSRLISYIDEVRALTLKTGKTARYCTNMLEAREIHEDLIEEIRRMTDRLLIDLEHTLSITGEQVIQQLNPRRRVDLFLFYKECLTNIIRHSEATRVAVQIEVQHPDILLTITDNGRGIAEGVPNSLKRRARFLNAKLTAESWAEGGTAIHLQLRMKRNER
jgi:signal transduction histidine kinase